MAQRKVKYTITAVDRTKAAFDKVSAGLGKLTRFSAVSAKAVLGVSAAATAAAGAVALFTKANVNSLDALGKTASKLGVNVEFLQQMRFAAEQTGIETRTLDMGLQRFIRRVAEAAKGTGEAKAALQQLGIEFTNADGSARDIRDILFDVSDGLANTASEGERVRLAFKFFDSEGVALVNTLQGGSTELKRFFSEAENLGILIGSDTTKRAEAFNDQLNIIKRQFTAITQNLVGAFLPVLQDVSEDLTKFLTKTKEEVGGFDKLGLDIAVGIVEATKKLTFGIASFLDNVDDFITDITIGLKTVQVNLIQTGLHTLKVRQSLFGLFKDLNKEILDSKLEIMSLSGEIVELEQKSSGGFKIMARKTGNALDKVIDKLTSVKEKQEDLGDGVGNKDKTKPLLIGMEEFRDSIGITDEALGKLGVSSMKKFEDSIIDGLKKGKLAFKDFANYVIEQLLRIAIQEAILKPLTPAFSSFFGNIFSFDNGGYTGMGVRAGGIDGKGGFPAILHPNESVIDHSKGQSMANSATVNFNINTVDASGFDELLVSRKGMITAMVNQAMNSRGKVGVV